jgi:uncharacterized membrane protein
LGLNSPARPVFAATASNSEDADSDANDANDANDAVKAAIQSYTVFKSLHIIGVVLLLGNVIVTGFWKALADRTGEGRVVAYAQRLVILTDWIFTGGGIALIVIGGYAMAGSAHLSLLHTRWLMWGQALFGVSAVIWLFVLLPVQAAQSRLARRFAADGEIPAAYWKLCRRWLGWGVIATLPLVIIVGLMILKV